MALLAFCWLIIEISLIPHGFQKWYHLSFFIHPLILIFCQILIWAKQLRKWVVVGVSHSLRIVWLVCLWVFRITRNCIILLFLSGRSTNQEVEQVLDEFEICNRNQIIVFHCCQSVPGILYELKGFEHQRIVVQNEDNKGEKVEDLDEFMEESNIHMNNECMDMDDSSSSVCSSELPTTEACSFELLINEGKVDTEQQQQQQQELDPFYEKYTERMIWFDILNYERTCGISAVLNNQLGSPSSFESIQSTEFSVPAISCSKMERRRLLRSLDSDFERVYVGQSCLCWEALHYQYRKVEILACSSSQNGVFCKNLAGNFQKFQVLLERFMEDERSGGKRFWNYAQGRFSLKSLLQVPEVSGYMEEEKEETKGEGTRPIDLLKAIENCIKAFWVFVKTDNKMSWGKFRSLLWAYPPVEDPKDLELFAELSKGLQKKELWLKDVKRKKRCWMKKTANLPEESQIREILYSMIDMKLVSRVLKMPMISTAQLIWCQQKLGDIEFREGRVVRAYFDTLFPPS